MESATQGRIWIGQRLADAAEVVSALLRDRPPRWSVLMEAQDALDELKRRGLLSKSGLPTAAE